MWRWLALVTALGGCRQILGIDEPLTGDASPGAGDGTTSRDGTAKGDGSSQPAGDSRTPPDGAPVPTGLIAEWRFDEDGGATATDDHPVDPAAPSSLTAAGGAIYAWVPGALTLKSGTFATASAAIAQAVSTSHAVSVELWIGLPGDSSSGVLAGLYDRSTLALDVGFRYSPGVVSGVMNGLTASTQPASDLTRMQLVITLDAAEMTYYVDGSSHVHVGGTDLALAADTPFALGDPTTGAATATYWRMRVFDRGLTSSEVQASYAAGPGDP